jgi:hypothetical protein
VSAGGQHELRQQDPLLDVPSICSGSASASWTSWVVIPALPQGVAQLHRRRQRPPAGDTRFDSPALDALRAFVMAAVSDPDGAAARRRCLMANSTCEFATADPEVMGGGPAHLRGGHRPGRRVRRAGPGRGRRAGRRRPDRDGAALLAAQQGLVFMGRTGLDIDKPDTSPTPLVTVSIQSIDRAAPGIGGFGRVGREARTRVSGPGIEGFAGLLPWLALCPLSAGR